MDDPNRYEDGEPPRSSGRVAPRRGRPGSERSLTSGWRTSDGAARRDTTEREPERR